MYDVKQIRTIGGGPAWAVIAPDGKHRGTHATEEAARNAAAFLQATVQTIAAPNPAPPRKAEPAPMAAPAPRASERAQLRCHNCGQGMTVTLTDAYNRHPLLHCPICGTPTLARDSSQIVQEGRYFKVDARCFDGVNPQLVALLYQNWLYRDKQEDPNVELPARFIDYLKEQLEA